ncbi:inositol 1,4,5-trisphosphate receptor-interacting protein-like 1 [Vidua macroura]|uniref:inositol 1,4,5-trisphosphate receptor-interacting protein-like 1 n=1 Tax=Vidua macroura TaxID=187451 RepID=UPI0023A8CF10|nr:inositol 1,4,5-trisphosphate receptor-interacting protein-like 1 [Vidua macroura]
MDAEVFLFVLLKSLILYPPPVGDGLDEETHLRMEVRAMHLEWERLRLEQEVEQLSQEKVQVLQLLALAVLLVLLLVLWLIGWKSSLRREENEEENDDANGEEVGNVAANAENNNDVEIVVEEEEDNDFDDRAGRVIMERIHWPAQDLRAGCEWTTDLLENYTVYFGHVLSDSFYPVLQRAIGVGSAFEGWSPREEDVVHRVFIPMTPPRGHSFHLELDSAGLGHVRNFRVRVQLECTCTRQQQDENMLCFLHHPEEELRRNQGPSLLDTLCTGSYLDVQKTARWFRQLVKAIWPALPQAHNWHLMLLPSTRSCQFKVSNGEASFRIEMLFGVRRGDSDVFVSSQPGCAGTPSTLWPETYDVAEMKFFKHIARQAPFDSLHLRCLKLFCHLLLGIDFSTYTMKTIVMHLLNIVPASQWRRRHFPRRLKDISERLLLSLEAKCLNHFIVGNQRLPQDIKLPPDVQMAEPPNLFYRLAVDPDAHSQGLSEYLDLQRRLSAILKPDD